MAGGGIPGAGIVIGHEVPGVEVGVHGSEVQLVVISGAGGAGY